jgi:hypothetical protein
VVAGLVGLQYCKKAPWLGLQQIFLDMPEMKLQIAQQGSI